MFPKQGPPADILLYWSFWPPGLVNNRGLYNFKFVDVVL